MDLLFCLFQSFIVKRLPTSYWLAQGVFLWVFFFWACGPPAFPAEIQAKLYQIIAKAWLLLFGLSFSVIFPGPSEAVTDMQTTGWKPAPHRRVHSRGSLLLLEILVLFKYSSPWLLLPPFSESSSEQRLSSVPPIPLPWCCLYSWSNYWSLSSSPQHSCIPAQGLPQASHCVGLCTAARRYLQYMLRVILSASGMNYFIAASLSEKSAWKLSQRAVLGATSSKWKQVTITQNK